MLLTPPVLEELLQSMDDIFSPLCRETDSVYLDVLEHRYILCILCVHGKGTGPGHEALKHGFRATALQSLSGSRPNQKVVGKGTMHSIIEKHVCT